MSETALERVLARCTEEVLEQMFFVRALHEPQPETPVPDAWLVAEVAFEGDPSGCLALRVTQSAASSIAADFLGEDESALSERQVAEVICELANIICGSVLSTVESATTFRLASPRLVSQGERCENQGAAVYSAILDHGALSVAFCAERPICPAT